MPSIKIRAYAKINTYLKIFSKRSDGFHDIETIMQNISLYDEISFETNKTGEIEIIGDNINLPINENNLCFKAAKKLVDYSNNSSGVKIKINKTIPIGAGLGGGSSDCAATIVALEKLWGLSLSKEQMIKIASEIGSDIPFFIIGGKALCKGRGEIIEQLPFEENDKQYIVLIKPKEFIPTKWAYEMWDLQNKNLDAQYSDTKNDFEKVVFPKYPNIQKAKKLLLDLGAVESSLSGSGSSVFGKVKSFEDGKRIAATAKKYYSEVFLLETIDHSYEITG